MIEISRSLTHYKEVGGLLNKAIVISKYDKDTIRLRKWSLKDGEIEAKIFDICLSSNIIEEINKIKNQDTVPKLLKALKTIYGLIDNGTLVRDISKDNDFEYFTKQGIEISNAIILMNEAIKKATE